MKKIVILMTLIVLVSISAWAEDPTPEQIMQKVADNMGLVQDMKAKTIYNGSFQGTPYPADEEGLIWIKKPDKSKTFSLKTGYKEIVNGSMLYQVTLSTQTTNLGNYEVNLNELDYYYHPQEFKDGNTLALTKSEVVDGEDVYTIEAKPVKENIVYSKIVLLVNYSKGIVIKKEQYSKTGYHDSTEEMLDSQQFTVEGGTVIIPSKKRQILYFDDGVIISEGEYKDIELNTGVSDSIFNLE